MATTSPNLGLRIWDQTTDPYDHDQLAGNWLRVDFHDHAPGRGLTIPTAGISDAAITTAKLADAATLKAVTFSAYRAAAYAAVASATPLVFDTKAWDTNTWFSTSTGRYTPQIAGYYRVSAAAVITTDLTANQFVGLNIAKNAVVQKNGPKLVQPAANPTTSDSIGVGVSGIVDCNGSTDYIAIQVEASASVTFAVGASTLYFQGELIGRS